jgi:GT2 family glycosyltransferase/SAM-dependent methyltransferase
LPLKELCIILLTKNGGDLFEGVLSGLFSCDGIAEAEVLMIDSGSTDRTLEYAARYAPLRVHRIPPAEFGHGRTRNLGARLTTGRTLVFIVQDATPATPDFLHRLTAPLAAPGVAAAFGRQLARPWTNRIEKLFMAATYPSEQQVRAYTGSGRLRMKDLFFSNVCAAIRRDVWEEIPFDEALIMSEDQQWAKRALQAGHHIVYEPAAAVYHSHNYRLKEVFKRNFDSGVSLVGIADDTMAEMAGYELRYLANGVRALAASGDAAWIPYFFAYEATRVAGLACGQRARLLPTPAKRMLSLHPYHWMQPRLVGEPAVSLQPLLAAPHFAVVSSSSKSPAPDADPGCAGQEYAARLIRLQKSRWKRLLNVQAPYRWNLQRLRPGLTLEIGCGIGRNLLHLKGSGVGVDLNAHSVKAARELGLTAFTPHDFLSSHFSRPETFDTLLLSHVAEHMSRPEVVTLIRQYLPLLKPHGRIILFTPQEVGFRSDPTHVEYMGLEKLQEICSELQFVPERAYSFPLPRIFGKLFIYNESVFVGRRLPL